MEPEDAAVETCVGELDGLLAVLRPRFARRARPRRAARRRARSRPPRSS